VGVGKAQVWNCGPRQSFSTHRAVERRSSEARRDAVTPREQADMSLTLRVKHFQLSVKCKGEKITKVDFRGEYSTIVIRSIGSPLPRISVIGSWLFYDAF
jgi:hypothetical protein